MSMHGADVLRAVDTALGRSKHLLRIETPDGPVAVIAPVMDRLRDKGIVWQDETGTWRGASRPAVEQGVMEHGVCDFCTAPRAPHVIEAPDFDMPFGAGRSVEGWAACDDCHQLVQANRRADLLRRAIERSPGGKFSAAALRALHAEFWKARDAMVEVAGIGAAL